MKVDVIYTLHPTRRRGVVMSRQEYTSIGMFILSTIRERRNISLSDLLDKAKHRLSLDRDRSWNLLQVKLDLEVRGLISSFVFARSQRLPLLRLTRKGQKAIKEKSIDENGLMTIKSNS